MKLSHLIPAALLAITIVTTSCSEQFKEIQTPERETASQSNEELQRQQLLQQQQQAYLAEQEGYRLKRNALLSSLNTVQASLDNYRLEKQRLTSDLESYQIQVKAYLMNHKMAVAAIVLGLAGAEVAIDEDNRFAQDAEEAGAGLALLAGIYALSNVEEIMEVADTINQADTHVKNVESRIENVQQSITADESKIQALNEELTTYEGLIK